MRRDNRYPSKGAVSAKFSTRKEQRPPEEVRFG